MVALAQAGGWHAAMLSPAWAAALLRVALAWSAQARRRCAAMRRCRPNRRVSASSGETKGASAQGKGSHASAQGPDGPRAKRGRSDGRSAALLRAAGDAGARHAAVGRRQRVLRPRTGRGRASARRAPRPGASPRRRHARRRAHRGAQDRVRRRQAQGATLLRLRPRFAAFCPALQRAGALRVSLATFVGGRDVLLRAHPERPFPRLSDAARLAASPQAVAALLGRSPFAPAFVRSLANGISGALAFEAAHSATVVRICWLMLSLPLVSRGALR